MFLGLTAGAVAIPIVGCAPGGSAPSTSQSTGASEVNTNPTSIPAATITVMDTWTAAAVTLGAES